ncbi:hypothetical protein DMENIID0001_138730 [Sergentomyia squamirostris]
MKIVDCPNCFTSNSDDSDVDSSGVRGFVDAAIRKFANFRLKDSPYHKSCRKIMIERKHKVKKRDLVRGLRGTRNIGKNPNPRKEKII